jgi:hypothetical protein
MIIESLVSGKSNFFWIIFHILLGALCIATPYVLIIWFYLIFFTTINVAINNLKSSKPFLYILLFTYLTGFEMLGRMSKAYPFIPMELGKYTLIIFGFLGILVTKRINRNYLIVTCLISLAVLYDFSKQRLFTDIINNYFGVLALCLTITFLGAQKFNKFDINSLLKVLLFSIIPSLIFSFIRTPELEDIEFKLSANFETSGGAATNQVSTVFGLAMFLSIYFWHKRIIFSGKGYLDLLLALAFFAQGLLTFSRGGIIVSVLAIILLFFLDKRLIDIKNIILISISIIIIIFTFDYINEITGGKLLLRYQGETEGTYNHGAEKDIKKMTSGRSLILNEDIKLWADHPIFGVGVGASRHIRGGTDNKVSSHLEFSRLLAEHGVFGLIYFFTLIRIGIQLFKAMHYKFISNIYFIIYFIGLITTFHSAMRTFITPLLIGLSVIGLQNIKKKNENFIHRIN